MSIQVGDSLNGYKIIEHIAEGGMGTVWKAKHPNLDRSVAIKLMQPELVSTEHGRQMFLDEIGHLSKLHSPQNVQVLDAGLTENKIPFMVTEYLSGQDAESRLESIGPMSFSEACSVGIEILQGLSEAHALGIIHGDLKPSNVFLMDVLGQNMPAVKLLDFGVATLVEEGKDEKSTLGSRVVRGSVQFMAPEQLNGGTLTTAVDLYNFGATLFTLLTGEYVFLGEPQEQIQQKLTQDALKDDGRLTRAGCPESLQDLIRDCLARRPRERPLSVQALRKRLEAIKAQGFSARPGTTTDVDVSVPDWLQSGFSHGGSDLPLLREDEPADVELKLDEAVVEQRDEVPLTGDRKLIDSPVESTPDVPIELDQSRTIEQAAPALISSMKLDQGEHYQRETVETTPFEREPADSKGRSVSLPLILFAGLLCCLGVILMTLIPDSESPAEKQLSERDKVLQETQTQLDEAKTLLETLNENMPLQKRDLSSEESTSESNIVLSLPRGQVAFFSDAKTKRRLCPTAVMSCRVPRHTDVEIKALGYQSLTVPAKALMQHQWELKVVKLVRKASVDKK